MRCSPRGFSLIEALIATTIVIVTLAGLAQLFVIAAAANNGSRANTLATLLAQEKLEELLAVEGDVGGGADFIDARGRRVGGGDEPTSGALYSRRWSADLLPGSPYGAAVLQVWITLSNGVESVRLVGVKTRRAP